MADQETPGAVELAPINQGSATHKESEVFARQPSSAEQQADEMLKIVSSPKKTPTQAKNGEYERSQIEDIVRQQLTQGQAQKDRMAATMTDMGQIPRNRTLTNMTINHPSGAEKDFQVSKRFTHVRCRKPMKVASRWAARVSAL